MTNEEAIKWLQAHSVVAIFHRDRTVLVLPFRQLDVEAFTTSGFKLEIHGGFALAYTEPGDELHHVVEAARLTWARKLSPVDQLSEAVGGPGLPVRFTFETNV